MDVLMPQLGETVAEGKISKWFVKAGDAVKPGDNLFEIETDKVSMEVPAISAGVLSAINVAAGETVPVGAVVAVIQGKGEIVSPSKPSSPTKQQTPLTPAKAGVQGQELGPRFREDERVERASSKSATAFVMEPFREVRSPERNYGPARLAGGTVVTPLARRLAGEAGIDLANIKGSGPHGRIVAADIASAKTASAVPVSALAAANIVITANVPVGRAYAMLHDTNGLSLADIVVKAWAVALQHELAAENIDIAISIGPSRATLRGAASKSLTAIAAARGDTAGASTNATTGILMTETPGIATVIGVLRPPYTTLLSIGSQRRVPVEAEDGTARFVTVVTATLVCDEAAVDSTRGAALLAAFRGYVANPVTMIV
jgi:pyruvate/2-oxoglutarate dehydrogenase complex dihydrolipoamide acyltransferase (E2) component